jgi:thiamine biosynthesis protein ThiS
MKVKVNGNYMEITHKKPSVDWLLGHMKVERDAVLVSINGEICVEEERLREGDDIMVISVVSGG